MRVLIACEFSGVVRDAFARRGHDAWSCDLLPSETPGQHVQGDVLEILRDGWDLLIAHPPCTDIASIGRAHFKRKRAEGKQQKALRFFLSLLNAPIRKIAVENPIGVASSYIRRPDQIIQPWQFGDEASKRTCLWLKNLPGLKPTKIVSRGEFITYHTKTRVQTYPKWFEQAKHSPEGHGKTRSRTFPGVAKAMATQWGVLPDDWQDGFDLFIPHRIKGENTP